MAAATGAGVLAATRVGGAAAAPAPAPTMDGHLAWAWQFDTDGEPQDISAVLAQHQMGVIMKTHEGTTWMDKWDESPKAIGSAADVATTAAVFESRGVPFHAWCVVEGLEPLVEARMCADVLRHGARSLTLDLEPDEEGNYWQAGPDEAKAFGAELRRLQPNSVISIAPDARPWKLKDVPMAEFASFSDEIAPQLYWPLFDNDANKELLGKYGVGVGDGGVTPDVLLDMSRMYLSRYGKPIRPIGPGQADDASWRRFVQQADAFSMKPVSVWRFGTSDPAIFSLLADPSQVVSTLHSTWLRFLAH